MATIASQRFILARKCQDTDPMQLPTISTAIKCALLFLSLLQNLCPSPANSYSFSPQKPCFLPSIIAVRRDGVLLGPSSTGHNQE